MMLCPHCKKHRFVTAKVPKDVVFVMPCPACHELSVFFRDRVIALSRRIIERGTFEERKTHLAHVIAEFLEAGMLSMGTKGEAMEREAEDESTFLPDEGFTELPEDIIPISEQEFEKFVKIDLKCIDNDAYFKRHFN